MTAFTDAERNRLESFADQLIPRDGNHPSASDIGVFGALYQTALGYNPDIGTLFGTALSKVPGDDIFALRKIDPALFERVAETIGAIYFMDPDVRIAVGFPGREARAARIDTAEIEGLLMPVFEAEFAPRNC